MAQVILTDVYRLSGAGRTMGTPRLEGIPTPFHVAAVPVANQPAVNAFVYSKIRFAAGTPMVEEVYSFETVAAIVTKANA